MVRLIAHAAALTPLAWLIFAAFTNNLGGDPQTKMMHELGAWGLILLLLSLTMTPARLISGKTFFIKYRRMLGLHSAFYLLLHLFAYLALYLQFNLDEFFSEILERPYITVGIVGIFLMVPLVATSTSGAQKRLGKSWRKLHKLTYLIAGLGLVHLVWQSKSDLNEPMLYVSWAVILLVVRIVKRKNRRIDKKEKGLKKAELVEN